MMRYFFNVRSSDGLKLDLEGAEFATLDLAIDEAVQSAREILAEKIILGEPVDGEHFEITTEEGVIVHTLPFRKAFRID